MEVRYKYTWRDKDRHDRERIYFRRRPGALKVLLPYFPRSEPAPQEFIDAYRKALAVHEPRVAQVEEITEIPEGTAKAAGPPKPGTFRWLCVQYFDSGEFQQLGSSTRRVRRGLLEHCFLEPTEPGASTLFGDVKLEHFSAKAVRVLRDRKVGLPEAGNGRVKAIRQVFVWGLANESESVTGNPGRDVAYLKNSTGGHHTWTIDEVRTYAKRHPLGTKAHLALGLLLFTGMRRSDVVKLGRQMVRQSWIHFTEMKGQRQLVKERQIPLLPILAGIIEASALGNMTYLVTEFDRPFTGNGFGNWFRKRCDEAGLKHCSAHGLRKAGATIAAENGATEHQLMAMFGWESPKQAALYTRKANRRRLAGDGMRLIDLGDLAGVMDVDDPNSEGATTDAEDEHGTDYPNRAPVLG